MSPIHFCTFASHPNYTGVSSLIINEIKECGYFNTLVCYDQTIIAHRYPQHVPFFTRLFSQYNFRGFGYWFWKPLVILLRLSEIPIGDILFYADSGCAIHTNEAARKRFQEWVDDIETHPTHRISFVLPHMEEQYTKGSLLSYMGKTVDKTGQHMATIQGYKHTPENIAFLQRIIEIASMNNYHFITDEPSYIPNADSFIDHRHDQSIYSLLIKERGSASRPDHYQDTNYPISKRI